MDDREIYSNIELQPCDETKNQSVETEVIQNKNINQKQQVSCRITNSIIKFLESSGYDINSLISDLPYSKEYLTDPFNWVEYEIRELVTKRASELTKNSAIMYEIGLSTPKLNPLGGLEPFVKLLAGPKTAYRIVPKYASLFDKIFKFKVTFVGNNQAIITMSMDSNFPSSKNSCHYAQGILAAIPTLWGLPPAEVNEKKCMCKPEPTSIKEGIQYEANTCVFEVNWQSVRSWHKRLGDNLFYRSRDIGSKVNELETNYRLLDQKNVELVERNKQLAVVREIAIGIDKVRTIDEALRLAVEQAREIDGVIFVTVQTLDESRQYVTTPYYSKISSHYKHMTDAIKVMGFDVEKELGNHSTSNKLNFQLSKFKVAQDLIENPKIMTFQSLAELLNGVWPKMLCDSIQKIMGVRKLVIVPITIEGEYWGSILYLLVKELPTDILEMIGAHCGIALKNIITLNNLETRTKDAELARDDLEKSVTRQKHIEAELRQSEERYKTIFESANDMLLLIDHKGKIVDVNGRVEDIGGYPREEFLGKDFRSLSKIMTRKSLVITAKNYLKRMAGLSVPVYDVEMITQIGEHRTIQINAVAIRKDGKTVGDLAILRDITELKQAENNLKLQKDLIDKILATIPNSVLLLDRNLQVIIANQTFYNLFQLTKNKVENKHIKELIITPELDQAIIKLLNCKEENTSAEFRYSITNSEKLLLASVFTIEEQHVLLVINDVTEERQRQERLLLTDRLASVGEMASGVAHELNNPLTSVIGLSKLLLNQELSAETKTDLIAINSEAVRCAAIVKNLLTFARKHEPTRDPQNIIKIVQDVLKLRDYEHKTNNINVETKFPSTFPDVLVDYFQMQQVFLNIILNAEAAMVDANGRGTLKINVESVNDHAVISFTDDGPGISKENLRFIFNPFFTTKEVGKGTGLGLSICYGIVTSHGGKIYATSENGKGSTFVVELPNIVR